MTIIVQGNAHQKRLISYLVLCTVCNRVGVAHGLVGNGVAGIAHRRGWDALGLLEQRGGCDVADIQDISVHHQVVGRLEQASTAQLHQLLPDPARIVHLQQCLILAVHMYISVA